MLHWLYIAHKKSILWQHHNNYVQVELESLGQNSNSTSLAFDFPPQDFGWPKINKLWKTMIYVKRNHMYQEKNAIFVSTSSPPQIQKCLRNYINGLNKINSESSMSLCTHCHGLTYPESDWVWNTGEKNIYILQSNKYGT